MEGLISKVRAFYRTNPPQVLASGTEQRDPSGHGLTGGRYRNRSETRSPGGPAASLVLNKRLTLPFLAFVAVLAAGLLFLMPGGLLQAQETAESITFYENSGDLVVTLTAWDPERVTPIHWAILDTDVAADLPGGEVRAVAVDGTTGVITVTPADEIADIDIADHGDFTVENGVVSFKDKPDYEMPHGGQLETAEMDPATGLNTYKVVVVASDGGSDTWVQYFKLTVEVLDSPEDGKVEWTVDPDGVSSEGAGQDLLEFQAGAVVTAALTDPDNVTSADTDGAIDDSVITWRWYRSPSRSGPWHNIFVEDASDHDTADAATAVYTASDDGDSYDVGMYLRVVADYVDRRESRVTAEFISPHPVKEAKQEANSMPEFATTATARDVQEALKVGSDVGAPVTATDVDRDVLNYTLAAQYSVAADGTRTAITTDLPFNIDPATGQIMTNAKLNFDHVYDADTGLASTTVPPRAFTVVVNATDSAGGETVEVAPNNLDAPPDGSNAVVTITLVNVNEPPEFVEPDTDRDDRVPDNVKGRAADKFEEGADPDTGTTENERAWNAVVSDYTVYDPEGVVIKGDKWSLEGADAALFTLTLDEDNVKRLRFIGQADFETPRDSNGDNIYEVTVVASDVEQRAKREVSVKITDSDEAGMIRLSSENPEAGTPVTATLEDSDGQVINVSWKLYVLDTADAMPTVGKDVTTGSGGMMYSFTPTSNQINKYLRVTATYTDRTEDENNAPEPVANDLVSGQTIEETSGHMNIRFYNTATSRTVQVVSALVNNPPEFVEGASTTRYVEENSDAERPGRAVVENIGARLAIDDADRPQDSHTWTLGGPDAASFDIDPANGQLRTRDALDHETKSAYTVVVTVQDGSGQTNDSDSITVTIEVKDLDEKPVMGGEDNIQHPEAKTGSVVTLTAWDPERVTPIHWAILDTDVAADLPGGEVRAVAVDGTTGVITVTPADEIADIDIADHGDFTVENGVVSFKDKPDYEMPHGGQLETAEMDPATGLNTYKVVVVASDGGSDTWVQYFKLTVEVLDSPEDGKVEWTVDPDGVSSEGAGQDLLEFQAGAVVTAALTDPDNVTSADTDGAIDDSVITWRWYRSPSRSGPWHNIFVEDASDHDTADAATAVYTASDDGDSYDVGMYLRVVADYVDRRGGSETAEFISPHPVKEAKQEANSMPEFAPHEHQRRVQEALKVGSDVGAPVTATDVDRDVLNYTLAAQYSVAADGTRTAITTDLPFNIDPATGQIMTNAKLNFDHVYDADTGLASTTVPPRAFTVVVNATDSAGGETVEVAPNNLDAPPDGSNAVVTITLVNVNEPPEFVEPDTDRDDRVPDNVKGRAADKFEEGADPDTGTTENERAWNAVVSDYTVYDPEGVVIKGDKWSLEGADAALFTLTLDEDNVKRLRFIGQADFETPRDSNGDNIYEVTVVASDVEQRAKREVSVKITDSDEAGMIRLSSENPEAGTPVTATLEDSDGQVINVSWKLYVLDTADAMPTVGKDVTTGSGGMMYSFTPTSNQINKYLRVTATYTDRTEDENNAPEPVANDLVSGQTIEETSGHMNIRFYNTATSRTVQVVSALVNNPPEFVEGASTTRYVEENSDAERPGRAVVENIGARLAIDDANGEGPGLHTWTLGGPDAASFDIDPANGQLRTRDALDHETKSAYTVVVTVEDSSNEPNDSDSITVTIEVKDLDEKPVMQVGSLTMSGPADAKHTENSTETVATYTLTGMNAANATWSLQGDDADDFDIMGGTLTFMRAPDYEDPADADMNNIYSVIVKANDGASEATKTVTVRVENEEEKGMVELSSLTPVVDVELTATLTDPDGSITGETWQWSRSSTMNGVFTQIPSANMASYTPKAADDSDYLMVEVTYTDGHGTGKDSEMATTGMVTTVPDQPGTLNLSSMTPVVGTELTATLTDPDGDVTGETWMWYKSMDSTFMDGTEMEIAGATMASYTPMAADEGYYLMVKVMYTDGHGAGKEQMATTTGMVTTVQDRPGTVTLSSMTPVVDAMLTATLTDPDGDVTGETWMWYKSMDMTFMDGTETPISGANMASYTPMTADENYYLLAKVMYTDGHGSDKMAMETSANAVTAGDLLVVRYDANGDGEIQKSEVIKAINDYLFPQAGVDPISKAEVIRLINLYLFP